MLENEKPLKPSKNQIREWGDIAFIDLDNGMTAIIDRVDIPQIRNYKWRAVKSSRLWYAKTTVGSGKKQVDLSLHRMLAKTPPHLVCHHKHRNSMDNRKSELENMTHAAHSALHRMNNLIVQFEQKKSRSLQV